MNLQFTDEFREQFSKEGFYAVPNKTKIYFYLDGEEMLVGNAVVANLEQLNEKIPIYSYNSPEYSKHLNGKRIVTGVIALRKITVAQFIKMVKTNKQNNETSNEIKELTEELQRLYQIKSDNGNSPALRGLQKIIASKLGLKNKLESMIKNNQISKESLYEMDNYMDSASSLTDLFQEDELLYYVDKNNNSYEGLAVKINFEGSLGADNAPFIGLKDVLFTRKKTEINVARGDIIEVYEFIGNPDHIRR